MKQNGWRNMYKMETITNCDSNVFRKQKKIANARIYLKDKVVKLYHLQKTKMLELNQSTNR